MLTIILDLLTLKLLFFFLLILAKPVEVGFQREDLALTACFYSSGYCIGVSPLLFSKVIPLHSHLDSLL